MIKNPFNKTETEILTYLCALQARLNNAGRSDRDSEEAIDLVGELANQSNAYGDIYNAVKHIVQSRLPGCEYTRYINYGGYATPFDDLLHAIADAQEREREEHEAIELTACQLARCVVHSNRALVEEHAKFTGFDVRRDPREAFE